MTDSPGFGVRSVAMEPTLRERKKQRARLELATAAMRLFRAKGFEATTVEEIAAAADYSPSTFFRHFGSKEDVVFLDIREDLAAFERALGARPAGTSMWQQIRQHIHLTINRFGESGAEFESSSVAVWLTDPALRGPFQLFCADWEQVIALAWAAAHGTEDPDADLEAQLVARGVVSACQAALHVHVHTGGDLQELIKQAFDALDRGLDRAALTG